MLFKGHKNLLAPASENCRFASVVCWQPGVVSLSIHSGRSFNSVMLTLPDNKRTVRTLEPSVGGYLFSHQR